MLEKPEAVESWLDRKMMRISWIAKVKKQEVYRRINPDNSIVNSILQRLLGFVGHVRKYDLEHLVGTGFLMVNEPEVENKTHIYIHLP